MERVAQGTNGEVWFDQLTAGQEFRSPFVDQPFLILILNADRTPERSRVRGPSGTGHDALVAVNTNSAWVMTSPGKASTS